MAYGTPSSKAWKLPTSNLTVVNSNHSCLQYILAHLRHGHLARDIATTYGFESSQVETEEANMSVSKRVPEAACFPCKKRRLKCDLRKPKCTKCELRFVVCNYSQKQLQWVGGAAVRGRLTSIGQTPHNKENTGPAMVEDLTMNVFSPRLSPSSLSPSPLIPESLMMYFRNAVWPRLQLSDQLISLDEEVLLHEPALREAILAVSQAHHHQLLGSEASCTISSGSQSRDQSRQLALSRFRSRIEHGVESEDDARRLFQIVCVFCILDGVIFPEEQGDASEQHLRGGCSMLLIWQTIPLKMLLAGGLQAHLFSVFATVDLVHSLLSGDKPHFQPSTWSMFADVHAWWGRLSCDDPFLTILKLYSEVAFLGNVVHNHLPNTDGSVLAKRCLPPIMRSLGAHKVSPARLSTPEFTSSDDWDAFCSIYEASAIIYVYRALETRGVEDEDVQRTVRRAVSTLVERPPRAMLAHCLIFPLLVVGSHCLYLQDRHAVSEVLSSSLSYLAFGNLVLMTNLLKDIWSQDNTNSSWWEMFHSVSKTVFLF